MPAIDARDRAACACRRASMSSLGGERARRVEVDEALVAAPALLDHRRPGRRPAAGAGAARARLAELVGVARLLGVGVVGILGLGASCSPAVESPSSAGRCRPARRPAYRGVPEAGLRSARSSASVALVVGRRARRRARRAAAWAGRRRRQRRTADRGFAPRPAAAPATARRPLRPRGPTEARRSCRLATSAPMTITRHANACTSARP